MNPAVWSSTERMLLDVLTCRVPLLTVRDARRLWQAQSTEQAFLRGMGRLIQRELVEVYALNLRRATETSKPVLSIGAGENQEVNCESVSQRLRARWSGQRRQTVVITASRKAANLFGSTAHGLPKMGHREHDALLGRVYVHYALNRPQEAHHWVGEYVLPKAGFRMKDPDAFLMDNSEPYRIVESGGSYSRGQVESLVDYARDRKLELEVW